MAPVPAPILHRLLPAAGHRLVVLDPGTRFLKVLAVEQTFGRLRILDRRTIEWPDTAEFNDSPESREPILEALGPYADSLLAIVMPQHRVISSTLDLPADAAAEPARFLEAEARKLSGLSEETLAHATAPLRSFGRFRHPCLLTLCKRDEIQEIIRRHVPPGDDSETSTPDHAVAEILPTGEALFAAMLATPNPPLNAVLVDLGAENTVVALLVGGQGVHATSFDGGSILFARAVAEAASCTVQEAETRLLERAPADTDATGPAYAHAVERWYTDLRRAISEWLDDFPELGLTLADLPVYLCGGGASQPGLAGLLSRFGSLHFHEWPRPADLDPDLPMTSYWVAYGAARRALGMAPPGISLLPAHLLRTRRRRREWEILQAVNMALVLLVALLLAGAAARQYALAQRKETLTLETRSAIATANEIAHTAQRVRAIQENLRPVLAQQRHTLESLEVLTALRQVRTNDDFWLVSLADAASYQAGATVTPPSTNTPPPGASAAPSPPTPQPARREFIAEICIPKEGDAARRVLSQFVTDLKSHPRFARVDELPPERRRNVIDPRVAISNHVYSVAIEIAPRPDLHLPNLLPPPANGRWDSRRTGSVFSARPDRAAATPAINP